MDVHDDPVPGISDLVHAEREEDSCDGLDDVLGEFPTVGFKLAPLTTRCDALVGDAGVAEPVLTQLGFHLSQATSGGQADEHDPGLHGEGQRTNTGRLAGTDRLDGGSVDVTPQLHNAGVGCPPRIDQRLEPGLGEPHSQRPHGFQGTDAALIAAGEQGDLSFLTQLGVGSVLVDGDSEHAARGLAIQILPVTKGLKRGGLACEPRGDPSLDRGQVGYHEPVPVGGDECGADELRERVGHGVVEQLDRFKVSGPHQASGFTEVW